MLKNDSDSNIKKLILLYAEQERKIKQQKNLLDSYKSKVDKLKKDSNDLNNELVSLFPEQLLENKEITLSQCSSENEEEDSVEFLNIENIYNKEITSLKQAKDSLKQHISQLLRKLGRDPEENEEYSSGE